jgi:hypothetical protein
MSRTQINTFDPYQNVNTQGNSSPISHNIDKSSEFYAKTSPRKLKESSSIKVSDVSKFTGTIENTPNLDLDTVIKPYRPYNQKDHSNGISMPTSPKSLHPQSAYNK